MRSSWRVSTACFGVLLALVSPVRGFQQDEAPLPPMDELLEKVRAHLHSDRYLLRHYTYDETQQIVELNKKGEPGQTETRVYEVFPSTVEELTYRRLVSKNGKPVAESKLQEQDRRHEKKVREHARKAEKRGLSAESEQEVGEEEILRSEKRAVDELFRLLEFSLLGREPIDGHSTLVVEFSPRPDFKVTVAELKPLKKIRGRAWIAEQDHQLVRIEAETLGSLKFGLGVIAKLNKGARMTFQRRRVNDEIWLPAEAFFQGTGRILVFRGFRFQARSQYSNYRKFSVGSSVSFDRENR